MMQCQNRLCNQLWDRDKNAALNILIYAKLIVQFGRPMPAFWTLQAELDARMEEELEADDVVFDDSDSDGAGAGDAGGEGYGEEREDGI
jgi:hypothetical protein